jgi:phage FluMu protein Com
MQDMQDFRCTCGALLFKADLNALRGRLEIKCRRCGRLISMRPTEPNPERHERHQDDSKWLGSNASEASP